MIRTLAIFALHLPRLMWVRLLQKEDFPESLAQVAVSLGPVWVKILQVLSTRKDIFPEPYIIEFENLRDHVPPEGAGLERMMALAFPRGVENVFASFERNPVGSGSVCQVHRAELPDGRRVAVKLLRPQARRKIESNFRFLRALVKLLNVSTNLRALDLVGVVKELETLLLSQTDLLHEVRNIQLFQKTFEHEQHVVIPAVFEELSSGYALVMEFVEGFDPDDFKKLNIDPLDLAERLDDLQDSMCLVHGVCHADLHPGNFFWNAKGDIILIDFGLVCVLSLEERNHLLTFYVAVLDGYYNFATRYFLDHFLRNTPTEKDREILYAELVPALEFHWVSSQGRPQFSAMYKDILRVLGRNQKAMQGKYSKIFLTLITLEGFIYSLDPNFNMLENYRKKKLRQAEYASVPEEAERLILGDFATYSTALFDRTDCSPAEAYAQRNDYVFEQLNLNDGDLVIDVGCGRGSFLDECQKRGFQSLGLTISRMEHLICRKRGHDVLWCSWEESSPHLKNYQPNAMVVIEMLFHLASLHQNKTGFLDVKLDRFFHWAHMHLAIDGRMFVQTLNIIPEFLTDQKYLKDFERVCHELPWLGFSTRNQILRNSAPYFDVITAEDHSSDLLLTYAFWKDNIRKNRSFLEASIDPQIFEYLLRELDLFIDLAEQDILRLNRFCFRKKVF